MNLASWLDNHQMNEKVFHMESHDFSVHWVKMLYATCWSLGIFFKFGGKTTNNIYQIIYWCSKAFFEREYLQILSKNVCFRTLSKSLSFRRDLKTIKPCKYEQTATKLKMMINIIFEIKKKQREYRKKWATSCQYSNLYWGRNGGIQNWHGSQKHQEKYCDCHSPVSLLVRRKTSQRAQT